MSLSSMWKRFIRPQAEIERLNEEIERLERISSTQYNQIKSFERQIGEKRNEDSYTILCLQQRVNTYFEENIYLWDKIPDDKKIEFAKEFVEKYPEFIGKLSRDNQ